MICSDCGKDVLGYMAMGIFGPVPHGCPAEMTSITRGELARLRAIREAAQCVWASSTACRVGHGHEVPSHTMRSLGDALDPARLQKGDSNG